VENDVAGGKDARQMIHAVHYRVLCGSAKSAAAATWYEPASIVASARHWEGGTCRCPGGKAASRGTSGSGRSGQRDLGFKHGYVTGSSRGEARDYGVCCMAAACRFTDSAEWLCTLSLCLRTWRSTLSARRSMAA